MELESHKNELLEKWQRHLDGYVTKPRSWILKNRIFFLFIGLMLGLMISFYREIYEQSHYAPLTPPVYYEVQRQIWR